MVIIIVHHLTTFVVNMVVLSFLICFLEVGVGDGVGVGVVEGSGPKKPQTCEGYIES